ncbi:hypothetical protein BDZ90DRAFT_245558 [Jaminaea rosea]|uniref:GST C-terminal domain-containing protein n=1 Tax=Jaminaea rosea TaxID=1569628 RepID=A0A316UUC9_9BASI|nr:hypothetical protein BDZ90DRAFT_245558 [Jaminaea rosea]PWN28889.1 hypothetical protein BDZ90DRAFT_245558 [Jaminaea rosea]
MSGTNDQTHKDGNTKWASSDGEFRRQTSSFRSLVQPNSPHPPARNRYKLFVALACPWAHRALIVRKLKGIDKVSDLLPVYVVDSLLGPEGWSWKPYGETHDELKGLGVPGTGPPPGHEDKVRIKDFYLQADPQYGARSTVPVLWDEEKKTIVSNESSELIRNLNEAFDEFVPEEYRGKTYYPQELRKEIDEVNEWVYSDVNNGVYKTGFATTQQAYENNFVPLFKALDKLEAMLAKKGCKDSKKPVYLVGDQMTEADIRLYTTIVRFDPVYHTHFKCNKHQIRDEAVYPNLHKWLRHLYWGDEAFKSTTDFESIKAHYYQSHPGNNPHRIVPSGPLPHIRGLDE